MRLRSHYSDDPAAKAAFKDFAREIFGLDFTPWETRGLWDKAYVPYSIFDRETVVANICVYPSVMTIEGETRSGLQLLTVGTLPTYRNQGLQRRLWEVIMAREVPHHDFVFLFTESAAGFYEKLGLRRQPEFFHRLSRPPRSSEAQMESRKLDPDDPKDFERLKALSNHRTPVSQKLGFENPNLLLFMLIGPYSDWLYVLPELDVVVVIEPTDESIRIHDIIGGSMPTIASIEGFLAGFRKPWVDLLFSPDQLGSIDFECHPLVEETLMTSVGFEMPETTLFPFSIRA